MEINRGTEKIMIRMNYHITVIINMCDIHADFIVDVTCDFDSIHFHK